MSGWSEKEIAEQVAAADPDCRELVEHMARQHNTLTAVRPYDAVLGAHLRCHFYGPMIEARIMTKATSQSDGTHPGTHDRRPVPAGHRHPLRLSSRLPCGYASR